MTELEKQQAEQIKILQLACDNYRTVIARLRQQLEEDDQD